MSRHHSVKDQPSPEVGSEISDAPKEHPILMSSAMVRAYQAGRKSQTRRVIKLQPLTTRELKKRLDVDVQGENDDLWCYETGKGGGLYGYTEAELADTLVRCGYCPYGKPGDRLVFRETFRPMSDLSLLAVRKGVPHAEVIRYRADSDFDGALPWKPAIHMPRWAARYTPLITEIRVERLQDISEADMAAEGLRGCVRDMPSQSSRAMDEWCRRSVEEAARRGEPRPTTATLIGQWIHLWDSLNAKKPGCSWAENPFVWVVTFANEFAGGT